MEPTVRVTTDVLRGQYNRIAETLAKMLGITVSAVLTQYKIMPFELVMAAYLSPNTNQYSLSPRKGVDNPAIPTANLLDQNDYFAMTDLGIRVGRAAFASNTYSNHGNYEKFTYPDPAFFSGNGTTAGSEAASLLTLVNGTTTVTVSGDNVIEGLNNKVLMYNPIGTYTASPLAMPTFGGGDAEKRGQASIQPHIIFDGGADNSFQITLAPGAKGNIDGSISTLTTDSGIRNILYVAAYGFKIKNLAKGAIDCPVKS